jgi:hypothetical protein
MRRRARDVTTEIHAFALEDPTTVSYLASGEVPGTLLSQWAMSEHDGVLRVASTVGGGWWDTSGPSESLLTTHQARGTQHVPLGGRAPPAGGGGGTRAGGGGGGGRRSRPAAASSSSSVRSTASG